MREFIVMAVVLVAIIGFFSIFGGLADTLKWFAAILVVGAVFVAIGFVIESCSGTTSSSDPCDGRSPSFLGDPRC